jgi:hypothetical protein
VNQFSRISALWASFYSADLYRDVAARWKGIGALYLLLLLALTWLPSAVRWQSGLSRFVAQDAPAIVSQMPAVSIKGGVMAANPPGRHVIQFDKKPDGSNEGQVIIDDTIDTIPQDAPADTFVVARREAGMIRPSRGERRVWAFEDTTNVEVSQADVNRFLEVVARWIVPVGYVCAVLGAFLFRIFQALLYGAFTTIYARRQSVSMDYATALRLCAVAITPVVILRTLLWFGTWEPAWYLRWPIAIAITVGYIVFAIRSVASPAPAQRL